MNRLSAIFARQLPLLERPLASGHQAPPAVVSLLDTAAAGPTVSAPDTPPPPGMEVDHRLASLPTPPPPRHLTGLLPNAADLPPPLPTQPVFDTTFAPILHDFGGLASASLTTMVNGGGALAAAKLAIPLLKDVQKLADRSKTSDAPLSALGHLATRAVGPPLPPPTHDDLRRALLGAASPQLTG